MQPMSPPPAGMMQPMVDPYAIAPVDPVTKAKMLEAPDPSKIDQMWADIDEELRVTRREYALNKAFDRGDQWVRYDSDLADALIRVPSNADEALVRTTINKFRARRRATHARVIANPLEFQVRASSASDAGLRKKRLGEHVLASLAIEQDWEAIRGRSTKAKLLGAHSAVCWEWDPAAKEPAVAVDPLTGTRLPAGGPKLTGMNINEFGVEPGSRSWTEATWWLRAIGVAPHQVQLRFKLDQEPLPDATTRLSPMGRALTSRKNGARVSKLTNVFVLTRRPAGGLPGCIVSYVNGKVVEAQDWYFPDEGNLNLAVFSVDIGDDSWIVDPWWSDLRQPQQMYNEVRTHIREATQRASNNRIAFEEGTVDPAQFSDAQGEFVEYERGAKPPAWMEAPNVNRMLTNEVDRLDGELNDVAGSPDVARGVAPGDRNSGAALAILAEKADGPLGPFASDESRQWSRVATGVLRLLHSQMKPDERRVSATYGESGVPLKREWTKADIDPEVVVTVPIESTSPRSEAALRASLVDLHAQFPELFQDMDKPALARLLGLSSARQMLQASNFHDAYATYENEIMLSGEVMIPDEWNDHGVHIPRHESLRNSPTYDEMSDEGKQVVDDHIATHKAMAAEAMAQAMAAQQQAQMQQAPPETQDMGDSEGPEDKQTPQEPQEQ